MSNDSKQQEREKHILDIAAMLIAHHGYDKTTIGDIAEAAGISRGFFICTLRTKKSSLRRLSIEKPCSIHVSG